MDIKIHGNHLNVTPAIENYIKEKFSHVPQPEKLNLVEFKIGVEKEIQYVHFDAHILHDDIHIEAKDENLYTAIDLLTTKIRQSFIKIKEKKNVHLKH